MDKYDFAEYITGYTCDSYADTSCDIMAEYYEGDSEHCYNCCMSDLYFQTCYTVYRLWNAEHTEEEALRYWKESCMATIEAHKQAT
jgi:proteasome lid subunit RPN8/RPN11